MKATLIIHVEAADTETKVVWWAESAELPGFSAAGDTLAELRAAASEAIEAEWGDVEIVEKLVGDERQQLAGPSGERVTTTLVPA